MSGVWIYADKYEQGLELLTAGRGLADSLGMKLTALVSGDNESAQDFIARGADEVLLFPPLAEEQPVQDYVPLMADEAREADPDIFLITASLKGKEMAARIAARLDTALCSECITMDIDDKGRLRMERLMYGGAAIQTVSISSRPQMATIPPRAYEVAQILGDRQGSVRTLKAPEPSGMKVIERKGKAQASGDISAARVIVCAGRGLEKQEDLAMVRELAGVLGGELACTRPLSEEKHWMTEESCIGLSAKEVKPALYLGIGVSGQIQHLVGIREAGIICAVNSDENAPIFEGADYGITGDLYQIVPALIEEFKK
ncbi:electron transfer flavoprotein, alpha subunit [hydrocarbon metagenome]|uniref:Electron transfer flavoprotein, alpha subunit n=1 Tax=hydrocarbon metagenome TaxID=938273 RepID=A0A0W8E3V4_9ZZZZ